MKNYINKIKSLVLVGAASLALSSCGDFLYIEPKTFVSEENFWNEKADIDQMVAGVYVKLQSSDVISRCIMWGETRSDNITEGQGATNNLDVYRTLKEDLKSTNGYTDWTAFYAVIGQCNIIIDRCEAVAQKDPTYTQSDVMATKAEMAAIRDLCYFYLVRAFKDVPYYTYPILTDADIKPMPAKDGDIIVKSLIEDLDTMAQHALKFYPKSNTNTSVNEITNNSCTRITQNAIYSILTDLCLWDGQYQRAVDYSQKVIDNKFKEYEDDYSKSTGRGSTRLVIFKNENDEWSQGFPLYQCAVDNNIYGNDHNQNFSSTSGSFESIFELDFDPDGSDSRSENGALGNLYGSMKSGSNDGRGLLSVPEKLLTDIYNKTSSTYDVNADVAFDHKLDVRYFTNIRPDDPSYSFGYVGKFLYSSVEVEPASTNPYYQLSGSSTSYDDHNWVFYRLTDVMLMQAEALIQLGNVVDVVDEESGEVIGTDLDDNLKRAFYIIWAVNRRSIMVYNPLNSHGSELVISKHNTKEEMLTLCLKERRRELMFEGKRWFDLLRQCHHEGNTNYVKKYVSAKIATGGTKTLFLNYESLFWPYNKKELRNNDALSQKPFYGADDDDDNYKLNN